jgi:hypothetical protein
MKLARGERNMTTPSTTGEPGGRQSSLPVRIALYFSWFLAMFFIGLAVSRFILP